MANMNMNFDPNAVEPDSGGRAPPIPEGRYVLQVTESDVVTNSKQNGTLLKLVIEVYQGELQGRKIFEQINIQHESVQAQEIGQRQLSALCHAAGITDTLNDSQQLHYKPFEADVTVEPERVVGTKTYGPRNAISKYHFEGSAPAAAPQRQAAPQSPPAPPPQARAATGARPWEQRRAS